MYHVFIDEIYPLIIAVRTVYVHSRNTCPYDLCLTTTIRKHFPLIKSPSHHIAHGTCLAVHLMLGSIWKRPVRNCRKQLRLAWRRLSRLSQSTSQDNRKITEKFLAKVVASLVFFGRRMETINLSICIYNNSV